ncbi:hypothetical protein KR51_00013150 [Rubidibacter lacunae KORDI 51-2]|uniref:Uncharacterized protein n=1 Tax=Rubidibacter lacunae KORDI 51-2 TaxID=582515 RepID=U5DMZ2_9CHRO|nr:hypothetical protein KR51_00013150 [Rubidibacter lacunae KORDI 51-2]
MPLENRKPGSAMLTLQHAPLRDYETTICGSLSKRGRFRAELTTAEFISQQVYFTPS